VTGGSEKGTEMARDERPASATGTAGRAERPVFDISTASQARMYDYLLGGKDNYAVDRAAVEEALKVWPDMAFTARANRAFLGRAVRYLAGEAGIRQFLDIGTGIPTAGNAHEVAQAIAPECRVVYVDYDPVVLAHARALLDSHEAGATEFIDADLRDTDTILAEANRLLDFSRPVAVTLIAILNALPDSGDPHAIVAKLMGAVPSGSYLALTHLGLDLLGEQAEDGLGTVQAQMMRKQFTSRPREQVARFFQGLELVEPGLVRVEQWRPEPGAADAGKSALWCAVGRKP
jgi:S-adenosyl methyltransferase